MRASVIQRGEGTGVRKATVTLGWRVSPWNLKGRRFWVAQHECGWLDHLNEWHNAFWAADHHVRYDCGKREQPSSGTYVLDFGNADLATGEMATFARRFHEAMGNPTYAVLNEGGMQIDPTSPATEDATVELGAITTELGPVQWEGRHLEGWSEGASGGSAGWWARVRRGRAR